MYSGISQHRHDEDYNESLDGGFRSRTQETQSGPLPGWIYCLRNPSIPNQLKIGLTTQAVENRMQQLDTTGVATPFEVVQKWLTSDVRRDEAAIHRMLVKYRTRTNREWFSIPDERTDQLVIHINKYIKRANYPLYELPTEMPEIEETRWEKLRGAKRLSIASLKHEDDRKPKKKKATPITPLQRLNAVALGVGYVVLGSVAITIIGALFGA